MRTGKSGDTAPLFQRAALLASCKRYDAGVCSRRRKTAVEKAALGAELCSSALLQRSAARRRALSVYLLTKEAAAALSRLHCASQSPAAKRAASYGEQRTRRPANSRPCSAAACVATREAPRTSAHACSEVGNAPPLPPRTCWRTRQKRERCAAARRHKVRQTAPPPSARAPRRRVARSPLAPRCGGAGTRQLLLFVLTAGVGMWRHAGKLAPLHARFQAVVQLVRRRQVVQHHHGRRRRRLLRRWQGGGMC